MRQPETTCLLVPGHQLSPMKWSIFLCLCFPLPPVPSSLASQHTRVAQLEKGTYQASGRVYSSADQHPCLSPTLQWGGEALPQEPWNSSGELGSGNWPSLWHCACSVSMDFSLSITVA